MWKFVVIFADADRIAEPGQGQCGWGCIIGLPHGMPRHTKSVTRRSFLTNGNLENFNLRQE